MHASGASAVLIMQNQTETPQDMNCQDNECTVPLSIPACMIENFNFDAKYDMIITCILSST